MNILGIETSCDETAVCLIEAEGEFGPSFKFRVLGNALHSQIATHAPYGGVYPNLAKREHAKNLVPLLEQVLEQASYARNPTNPTSDVGHPMSLIQTMLEREPELLKALEEFLPTHGRPDIDAIAVTHGPGLEPALWVGINFARALSAVWDIPIVPVNHLEGHITMAAVSHPNTSLYNEVLGLEAFEFPALALLISGGHTQIDLMLEWGSFKTIGETRDDAVGEAFDKVARMLGIPYPGGAALSTLAAKARQRNEATPRGDASLRLPRPMIHDDSYDFSFSGLKTAVLRLIDKHELSEDEKMKIALEFENAATDVLVAKTVRAAEEYGAKTVVVGGGVSANSYIKELLSSALQATGCKLLAPPPALATDNALMIALAGYFRALKNEFIDPDSLRADGNLRLGQKI